MRISRQLMFMEIAHVVAKRSTCFRLNVGAIVVVDNRIVSMGYNGQNPGQQHCQSMCGEGGCNTIHAEANALRSYGATPAHGKSADLYVTDSPCTWCADAIKDYGIERVFFSRMYRDTSPIRWLESHSIPSYRVLPSGVVIDVATGQEARIAA